MFRRTREAVWAGKLSMRLWPMEWAAATDFQAVPSQISMRKDWMFWPLFEAFHDQCVIESHRLGEIYFQSGVMGTGGRGPERVEVVVERAFGFGVLLRVFLAKFLVAL